MSANKNSFDKNLSQSDCVFQVILTLEDHNSPSPLGDSNGLFKDQIGVLFKTWNLHIIYHLNGINLAP